jgi:hypothetical protein
MNKLYSFALIYLLSTVMVQAQSAWQTLNGPIGHTSNFPTLVQRSNGDYLLLDRYGFKVAESTAGPYVPVDYPGFLSEGNTQLLAAKDKVYAFNPFPGGWHEFDANGDTLRFIDNDFNMTLFPTALKDGSLCGYQNDGSILLRAPNGSKKYITGVPQSVHTQTWPIGVGHMHNFAAFDKSHMLGVLSDTFGLLGQNLYHFDENGNFQVVLQTPSYFISVKYNHDTGVALAITESGVHYSLDKGLTWTQSQLNTQGSTPNTLMLGKQGKWFLTTVEPPVFGTIYGQITLFKSTDNGKTWSVQNVSVGTFVHQAPDLGTLVRFKKVGEELFWQQSTDDGITWQFIFQNYHVPFRTGKNPVCRRQNHRVSRTIFCGWR